MVSIPLMFVEMSVFEQESFGVCREEYTPLQFPHSLPVVIIIVTSFKHVIALCFSGVGNTALWTVNGTVHPMTTALPRYMP